MKIQIDDEFSSRLPPLTEQAHTELEESLRREGCREPLVVWRHDGKATLLDGHNRYAICRANNIPYRTAIKTQADIPDRDAAAAWILRNQLSRRNLNPDQFTLYLGKLYNPMKREQGGTGANQHSDEQRGQNDPSAKTADTLAAEHGVSARTVKRAGELAEAVETLKETDPDIEKKVASGKGPSRKKIIERAKAVKNPKKAKADETPKDADGREIPKHLREIFAAGERLEEFARALSTIKSQVKQAMASSPVTWSQFDFSGFDADIKSARGFLTLAKPHIVCSYCGGSDSERCEGCQGSGFLSKIKAVAVPREMRPPQKGKKL